MRFKHLFSVIAAAVISFAGSVSFTSAETDIPDEKLIALTFDDGPNTYTTPKILDLLEQYDAHASFFLIGDKINDESAEVVKRAYAMGCEINSHSKTHPDMSVMTAEEIEAEMKYVDDYVYSIIGEYPKFFRPPYLNVSQTMYDTIDIPFICGYSSKDSDSTVTAEQRAENVLSQAKDGAIILVHDFYGNDKTVEALETILPELQAQGYEFVTLTELFERKGETPVHDMCYNEVQENLARDYVFSENFYTGEIVGANDWDGWGTALLLDPEKLTALGDTYAIEIDYKGERPPVVVLHRWKSSEDNMWEAVQPSYYNGSKAIFMAKDLLAVLDEYGFTYTDMSKIMVRAFVTELTVTKIDIKVKPTQIMGDVNLDGAFDTADLVRLQSWLLRKPEHAEISFENGDFTADGKLDSLDLCLLKAELISA